MIGNILLKPYNIVELQSIKDDLYSNGSRFSIKPHGAIPHITIGQFSTNNFNLINKALFELSKIKSFTILNSEWILTKKFQKANHLLNKDYYWLSLLFNNNQHLQNLFRECDKIMYKYKINDNESYINNVKKVKKITDNISENEIKDTDCIANHLNISNYSRPESVEQSYKYINDNLPNKLEFGTIFVSFQKKNDKFIFSEFGFIKLNDIMSNIWVKTAYKWSY